MEDLSVVRATSKGWKRAAPRYHGNNQHIGRRHVQRFAGQSGSVTRLSPGDPGYDEAMIDWYSRRSFQAPAEKRR